MSVKTVKNGVLSTTSHPVRDSYAAQWALENGIPVEYPDSLDWLNN